MTPDDLYPATIYTLDGDGVADFQQDFTAGGQLDALYNLFTTHAEYLGLTPTQIADATTSIDGDLTNIDISDNINNFDAWIGALEHGIGSSGLFESLFESLQLYFDQHVLTRAGAHRAAVARKGPRDGQVRSAKGTGPALRWWHSDNPRLCNLCGHVDSGRYNYSSRTSDTATLYPEPPTMSVRKSDKDSETGRPPVNSYAP